MNQWRRVAALVVVVVLIGVGAFLIADPLLSGDSRLPSAKPGAPTAVGNRPADVTATPTAPVTRQPTATPTPDVGARVSALQGRLRENPSDVTALNDLGGLFFQLKQYGPAADNFAASLEISPADARIRTDYASSLLYLGMVRLARKEYQRAVDTDPALADAHFNLAIALSHSSPADVQGALAHWRDVIAVAPESEVAKSSQQYISQYEKLNTPEARPNPH